MQANDIDARLAEVGHQFGQYVGAYASELNDDKLYGEWLAMAGVVAEHVAAWEVVLADRTGRVRVLGPLDDETPVGTAVLVTGTLRRANGEPVLDADFATRWEDVVADGPQAFGLWLSCSESFRYEDREDREAAFDALVYGLDRRPHAALMERWREAWAG